MAALEEAYRNSMMVGKFPACILNISLSPETVDVNVHPAKTEIRFAYVFVMGKKLKKGPESYEDVKDAVIKDYQAVYQDAWLKDLKRKYKVEINQEVLKTVNNNGSN